MRRRRVETGAVPAEAVGGAFPDVALALSPPIAPMEALAVDEVPGGAGWLYEPKWDGFRCLAFRRGATVALQSKSGQPLARYFPEAVAALGALPAEQFVLDGELVVLAGGRLDFDALLQRIHPAETRIRKLAAETPTTYLAFDLLVDAAGRDLTGEPLAARRAALERLFAALPGDGAVRLSPAVGDRATAERWMHELGRAGLDGVVAKRLEAAYTFGERTAMRKVKRRRTADCVVGGFRYAQGSRDVGSLLLGLYDDDGLLHHVGFAASFSVADRRALAPVLEPLVEPPGFTGAAPGGPSRWSAGRSTEWQPLRPSLVCEVRYDHFAGRRFRHGTKLLRWRPDKTPRLCTFEQVEARTSAGVLDRLLAKAG